MADNKDKKALNVPALRFSELTEEWKDTTLDNECTINPTSDKLKAEFVYIDLESVEKGELTKKQVIEKASAPSRAQRVLQNGDVLFQCVRPYQKNNYLVKDVSPEIQWVASTGYAQLRTKKNNPAFIYHLLNTSSFNKKVIVRCTGSSYPAINSDDLSKIHFYICGIEEQKRIADFLSLLDERIATQNKIIERLETLIKGIVDFIFTANKFPKVPFKEIYIHAGEGGTPATSIPEYYDNGTIPFIKIDDLQNKYIESNKDYITELGLQKSSAWIVPSNSIIYSNGATIGAISINLFPVCTKQGILGIVPKANINVKFLYYFMTSTVFTKAVERIVTEGTMRTAYLKDINHILCPIPCSARQNEIAKLLSNLSAKLENEMAFQKKLREQKDFLLSQMFI